MNRCRRFGVLVLLFATIDSSLLDMPLAATVEARGICNRR